MVFGEKDDSGAARCIFDALKIRMQFKRCVGHDVKTQRSDVIWTEEETSV